jgi:ribosomal protein L22
VKGQQREAVRDVAELIRGGRADVAMAILRSDLRKKVSGRVLAEAIADLIEALTTKPKKRLSEPYRTQLKAAWTAQARELVRALQGKSHKEALELPKNLRQKRSYNQARDKAAQILGLRKGQIKHALNPSKPKR